MAWVDTILAVLKLIGFARWVEAWEQKRRAKQAKQAVVDAPVTDDEWTEAAKRGDL